MESRNKAGGSSPKDVLVVDDNPINQVYFCAVLQKAGYEILSATSGPEALRLTANFPFQLILMDIRMPEMDGYQTIQALRGRSGFNQNTPAVAVSAEQLETHQRDLFAGFLIKPVAKEQLLALVSGFIEANTNTLDPNAAEQAPAASQRAEKDSAPPENGVIDYHHGMAAAGNDPQIAQRLQSMLKKELPGQLAQLRALHARQDVAGLRELLHLMVGSASFCGALDLAARVREYSDTIKAPDCSTACWNQGLHGVEQAAAAVLDQLDQLN